LRSAVPSRRTVGEGSYLAADESLLTWISSPASRRTADIQCRGLARGGSHLAWAAGRPARPNPGL